MKDEINNENLNNIINNENMKENFNIDCDLNQRDIEAPPEAYLEYKDMYVNKNLSTPISKTDIKGKISIDNHPKKQKKKNYIIESDEYNPEDIISKYKFVCKFGKLNCIEIFILIGFSCLLIENIIEPFYLKILDDDYKYNWIYLLYISFFGIIFLNLVGFIFYLIKKHIKCIKIITIFFLICGLSIGIFDIYMINKKRMKSVKHDDDDDDKKDNYYKYNLKDSQGENKIYREICSSLFVNKIIKLSFYFVTSVLIFCLKKQNNNRKNILNRLIN